MTTEVMTLEWLVESVRLTLFPLVTIPLTADVAARAYKRISGTEPEELISRASVATHQAQGPFMEGRLIVAARLGRIDAILAAQPAPPIGAEVATLGPYRDVVREHLERAVILLENDLPLHRVALGCIFIAPAADSANAYRGMAPLLPSLTLDPEGTSDFGYQINRPRSSRVIDGLRINRISKWSVQATTTFAWPPAGSAVTTELSRFAVRLETDVNTVSLQAELRKAAIRDILNELQVCTVELVERGDRK